MTKLGFKRSDTLSHVTSNGTVTTDIAYRRIFVKQGIEAINGHSIRFTDGTEEEFDTLIAATGYRIDLDMLPPEVVRSRTTGWICICGSCRRGGRGCS